MTDDISYAALAGVPAETLHALLTAHAATALAEHQDPGWPRDRALWDAVDAALAEAAALAGPTRDAAAPAATARRRWLDGLVARELATLSTHFWATERFRRVRLLERLGLVTLTPDDTYVLAMVSGLGPDAAEVLREDPELVERALWRVFEVEGGGEVSLANVDKFGGDQWRRTFLQLCADGTLDRARVLDACLSVLTRDFSAYRAGWFSRTHLALVPTDDELTRAQGTLRRLLGAEVPATVAFAVKLLSRIRKTGDLAAEETLDALPPATLVKTKGTALAALRLAQRLLTDHPEMGTRTTLVARTALGHPDADVQRAAALLLTACGESDTVTAAADVLDPRARADLGLGVEVVATPDAPRVQRLLPPADPVRAADLADRTAGLLEDASDAREVEAVLAALVSPDAAEALAPLRKRARTVAGRGSRTPHGAAWLPGQVARLVLDLLGEPVEPATPDTAPQRFVVQRLLEVSALHSSLTAPLLATPDLPGGWVSPETLARRLANQPHPRHHDLVAALLRLAPEGRAEALAAGSDLPPAVRFALGDPPGSSCDQRPGPAAWWRAAERSRAAYAPDELPTLDSQVRSFAWEEGGRQRRGWYARFTVATAPALAARADGAADDDPTTVALPVPEHGFATRVGGCTGDWIPTLAALWPQDAEHFLTLTCLPVLQAPDGQVDHDVPRTLDALAQHPGRLGPLAAAALAAGLSAGIRQHRLHASDAFVDLAPSGRIGLPEVADVMARHAPAWPATRWAQSLGDVAEAPGGAGAVVDLLTLLLPRLPADHRRVGALLDLLRSLLLRSGRQVDDPELTKWLATFSGSSAAARSARQLREGVRP